jgi:AcrR family transcriptional regulator
VTADHRLRRSREREALRRRILAAARELLSERGLSGLSMRAVADRIEYSAGTLYLYVRDKDELIRELVGHGFGELAGRMEAELRRTGSVSAIPEQLAALGRGYARFALEHTALFRVMFELPGEPRVTSPASDPGADQARPVLDLLASVVERGQTEELLALESAHRGAAMAWAVTHGTTSLYLAGWLGDNAEGPDGLDELVSSGLRTLYAGWRFAV